MSKALDQLFSSPEHESFRSQVRRFVETEISPNIDAWEAAAELPRELHKKAADIGLFSIGFPEAYGGLESADNFYDLMVIEELSRTGSGGLIASLMTHKIACPPIAVAGNDEQKAQFLAPVLAGEKLSALAITEPSGGSDVANLRTTAKRDGDDYIVNGSKTFITNGMRADFFVVAVRTGAEGLGGVSLLIIESDRAGVDRTALKKMGWQCSDTATLYFENCRVPVSNRLGPENAGFLLIMQNFNSERLGLIAQAWAMGEVCYEEALAYAKTRETFGRPIIKHQVVRHKLIDMRAELNAIKAQMQLLSLRINAGESPVAELSMLKSSSTFALERIAGDAVQILGGAGYLQDNKVERIFRETKVLSIGGGANEVMKDLAARQMGYFNTP